MNKQVSGNKCMKLDKTELSWAAARNVCKEAGADLALVTNHDDANLVFTMMIMMIMMIMMDGC